MEGLCKMIIKFNFFDVKCIYYNNDLKYHRLDGLCYEDFNGDKFWFKNGNRHREDGPAIEWSDGDRWFFINGNRYEEKEYWGIIRFKGYL